MDWILFKTILVVSLFALSMAVAAYSTWAERKVAAIMQDRIGPNRSRKFGLLQPLADGGKFFFKEDFIPEKAEKFLFFFGPGLVMFISLITGAVIPWGTSLNIGGESYDLQVANIDVRVTARKDQYGEVEEFICNECRFEKKDVKHWNIEGPRHISRHSVISLNHYQKPEDAEVEKLEYENAKEISKKDNLE